MSNSRVAAKMFTAFPISIPAIQPRARRHNILLEEARKNGFKNEEFGRIVRERKSKMNLENDIWKTDAIDYVPRTSSGYVGWRSNPNSSLEKFGPLYISPRHTLPYQPPYNCIILG
ncbi:unnamed protein product [Phaedon cochleariae]|uniref:Uncharacterized protein n=1 Tax=Phaedon cochleariae TaxID=80249 RepID=A0A9P0DRG2_PHACE|nr:unnamed protein product [Phaedon cochleariae]